MKRFELQGVEFVVDDNAAAFVRSRKWEIRLNKRGEVLIYQKNGRALHHQIANTPSGMYTSHVDGDTLNNCRVNLRSTTHSLRRVSNEKKSSRFKGVALVRKSGLWRAAIKHRGKQHRLGLFESEKDAARAYDKAATELLGGFAYTNEMMGLL